MENAELKAWTQNGILHVSGVAEGATVRVYNLNGQLIYSATVVETHGSASLPERGIYIVSDGVTTVKTVY